jgi:hypothetical protein
MIGTQAPTLQIFISAQSVLAADVPWERFPSITTIEANNMVVAYGLPDRHSRGANLFRLNWLAKLSKCSMHRCNEFRNLIGSNRVTPHVATDDLRRQVWIDHFVVHGTISILFSRTFKERYTLGCCPG